MKLSDLQFETRRQWFAVVSTEGAKPYSDEGPVLEYLSIHFSTGEQGGFGKDPFGVMARGEGYLYFKPDDVAEYAYNNLDFRPVQECTVNLNFKALKTAQELNPPSDREPIRIEAGALLTCTEILRVQNTDYRNTLYSIHARCLCKLQSGVEVWLDVADLEYLPVA